MMSPIREFVDGMARAQGCGVTGLTAHISQAFAEELQAELAAMIADDTEGPAPSGLPSTAVGAYGVLHGIPVYIEPDQVERIQFREVTVH